MVIKNFVTLLPDKKIMGRGEVSRFLLANSGIDENVYRQYKVVLNSRCPIMIRESDEQFYFMLRNCIT